MSDIGMQGFREASTGWIPTDWVDTTLGKLVTFRGGNGFNERYQGETEGDFPFIKVSDFNLPENGKYIKTANNWIAKNTAREIKLTLFPAGAIVFPKVGAALLLNRRRILVRETAIDNNLMAATPIRVDGHFFYFHMQTVDFKKLVQAGAIPSVNQSQLEALPIALPPLFEQQKIAAILTAVDDKIDVIERQIYATQTLKNGLMQILFSRGVGTQDAEGRWEPARSFILSELGEIPGQWQVRSIGETVQAIERPIKMSPDKLYTRVTIKRNYGGIKLRDIVPGFEIKVKTQFAIQEGDFLISERQIVHGAFGIVPKILNGAIVSNEYVVLQPRGAFDINFFKFLNQSRRYAKYFYICSQGVNIEKFLFKQHDWFKKKIPIPPHSEQVKIVSILTSVSRKIDSLFEKRTHYQTLKRGLMQKLLTGEWRVHPDPEPTP